MTVLGETTLFLRTVLKSLTNGLWDELIQVDLDDDGRCLL